MPPLDGVQRRVDGRWQGPAGLEALRARFAAAGDGLAAPDRRRFMRLMAASLALAGLDGCDDDDAHDEIVPPVTQAVGAAPGRVLTYATSALMDGFANGVLARTVAGRPLKIEGNPAHPWSRGGTDVFGQASVLGLYDPFRSQSVAFRTRAADWAAFRLAMLGPRAQWQARGGAGLALLVGPLTSPSVIAQIAAMQAAWPRMRVFSHAAVSREAAYAATRTVFGRPLETSWRLDGARALVSLDGDLLDPGPHQVGAARGWSEARRAITASGGLLGMHAATAVPNLTSAKADYPLRASPALMAGVAEALLARAGGGGASADLPSPAQAWCAAAWQALDQARGAGVVTCAMHADPAVQAATARLNAVLGNVGHTVLHTAPLTLQGESLAALVDAMHAGQVDTLVMLGTNPVYDAPGELGFAAALGRVALKLHAGLYQDESAAYADWHLPMAHPLESWGDARALDGSASLVQPTIAPLYGGRTAAEVLSLLADVQPRDALSLLRARWTDDSVWHAAQLSGTFEGGALPPEPVRAQAAPEVVAAASAPGLQVVFRPDPTVWDGSVADNAWLQELPKPLSKLVWENVVQISPVLAHRSGIVSGDVVRVSAAGRQLSGPAWIAAGQADEVVCVYLGYGKVAAGQLSAGLGYDAYALRATGQPWRLDGAAIARTGAHVELASTQEHARLDGEDLLRVQHLGGAAVGDGGRVTPSLYPPAENDGRAWGMVIDIDACIGCNACVTACQAENNIAVVGREEVLRGREMHWLRIDGYARPDPAADGALSTAFMPVPCMQCEQAPCEIGCPVEATLHDHEGLNLMVYNRCVGTRACSGYCPYKVRHFNYADYSAGASPSMIEQRNPDVTVRARGVMEKCTYCVQRIAQARAVSVRDDTPIPDGAVQTACQSACPTRAIVFGDLAQPDSAVARAQPDPRRYALLGELGTRPRTTYLAALAPAAAGQG